MTPPPPACLHLRPLPPGRWQAPHRVGGLVGPGVGQPPRPLAPYPPWARGEVVRRGETWPTRFMPSYPWWAALPEPGEIHATARWPDVLRHNDPGPDRDFLHEVF